MARIQIDGKTFEADPRNNLLQVALCQIERRPNCLQHLPAQSCLIVKFVDDSFLPRQACFALAHMTPCQFFQCLCLVSHLVRSQRRHRVMVPFNTN